MFIVIEVQTPPADTSRQSRFLLRDAKYVEVNRSRLSTRCCTAVIFGSCTVRHTSMRAQADSSGGCGGALAAPLSNTRRAAAVLPSRASITPHAWTTYTLERSVDGVRWTGWLPRHCTKPGTMSLHLEAKEARVRLLPE